MFRKAQSAMEYLMTYGWAILVILIALGAMFYLGVFDAKTPNNCQIQSPFSCMDVLAVFSEPTTTFTFSIGVGAASSPKITSITVNGDPCTPPTPPVDVSLSLGQVNEVSCTNTLLGLEQGDKFTGIISLSYTSQYGGLTHNVDGSFSGTVE